MSALFFNLWGGSLGQIYGTHLLHSDQGFARVNCIDIVIGHLLH